jgi:DNA transformation protein and related proteins
LSTIGELKSLGPKSQDLLARVGITTVEELRRIGSVAAYCLAKRANAKVSLNLLWGGALQKLPESALTGGPWQQIARVRRTSLLLAVDEYEKND